MARVRMILANVGAGNLLDPVLYPNSSVTATSEETFLPAANLTNLAEVGRPWQSATAGKVDVTFHYGGTAVSASAFCLGWIDAAPDGGVITLELWSSATPGAGELLYRAYKLPIWYAYMAPPSTATQQWGEFTWGSQVPGYVRRNYPTHFLHVLTTAEGIPRLVTHRSGRYTFEMLDGSDSPLGYWRASGLSVSQAYVASRGISVDWQRSRKQIGTPVVEGPSGVVRASGGGSKREARVTLQALPRDEILHRVDSLAAELGTERPFVAIPDPGVYFPAQETNRLGTIHQPSRPDRLIYEAGFWRLQDYPTAATSQAYGQDGEPLWDVTLTLEEWV